MTLLPLFSFLLVWVAKDGKAEMIIGQHFLEGNVVTLKAPYLLIDEPEDEEVSMDGSSDTSNKKSNADKELEIRGVVKQKVIFKTRPKPVGLKRPRESSC
jgi:hypothetical protein